MIEFLWEGESYTHTHGSPTAPSKAAAAFNATTSKRARLLTRINEGHNMIVDKHVSQRKNFQ